jgi:4-amino-4-deoxy-L-arabinose transferase-like glycosyltransferase
VVSKNPIPHSQTNIRPKSELKYAILLGLIICLAFGLRIFRLGHQELRGDEAFDALFSQQPVSEILSQLQVAQPYPPLFHVSLHHWLDLVGQSELSQRLPALISGVLLVPLTYQLARSTLGRVTALIAALLVAINPFLIWHAQDGRMYSLLAMLSAASLWLGLRLWQDRTTIWTGLAYWAVTALALLTHYFAWWLLLAENLAALLVYWKQTRSQAEREAGQWSRLGWWLVWQAAIFGSVLPWLIFATGLLTSHTSSWIPPMSPLQMVQRSLLAFSMGSTLDPAPMIAASLIMGILFVLGCLYPPQHVDAQAPSQEGARLWGVGRGLLIIYAGVPLLATMLLSLLRPAFDEKYLIAIVSPFLILVAHGLHLVGSRWRIVAIAVGIVVLVATSWSLYNYYFDPAYAKSPSWRELVESIETRVAPGDVIIQNYPDPGLNYYYQGEIPLHLLPAAEDTPPARTGRRLQKLADAHLRIWLIPGPAAVWDAEGSVQQWLGRHADLVDEQTLGTLHLELYHTPATFAGEMRPVEAQVGDQIQLLGYRLAPGAVAHPGAGDSLTLTLYWQALQAMDANYTAFVHLSGPDGQIWGQHDGQPVEGSFPTSEWAPGQIVVDRHQIEIDAQAPDGTYQLLTGLYDNTTGQRLPVSGTADVLTENRILLTLLEVAGPAEEGSN